MTTTEILEELGRVGVISTSSAMSAGLTERDLRTAIRTGALTRLTRGRYALPVTPTDSPAADRALAHLRRAEAIRDRYEGRAVLSHTSALAGHGLPLYGVQLGTAHLTSRAGRTYRRRRDHILHPCDTSTADLATSSQLVVPADALIQSGRSAGPKTLLVAGDAALHRRLVTPADLAAAAAPAAGGLPPYARRWPDSTDAASRRGSPCCGGRSSHGGWLWTCRSRWSRSMGGTAWTWCSAALG